MDRGNILFGSDGCKKLKNVLINLLQTCSLSLHMLLTDGLEWCGLLVLFLSAVWTHSDGTHSLQSIH